MRFRDCAGILELGILHAFWNVASDDAQRISGLAGKFYIFAQAVLFAFAISAEFKLDILSFALASETRDTHTPVTDRWDCPPPSLAQSALDSVPR